MAGVFYYDAWCSSNLISRSLQANVKHPRILQTHRTSKDMWGHKMTCNWTLVFEYVSQCKYQIASSWIVHSSSPELHSKAALQHTRKQLKQMDTLVFRAASCFLSVAFFLSPHLIKLLRRRLQCCFAVKLQRCYETSPDFPSACGRVNNGFIFNF